MKVNFVKFYRSSALISLIICFLFDFFRPLTSQPLSDPILQEQRRGREHLQLVWRSVRQTPGGT